MISYLPQYRGLDGSLVNAGRIHAVQGPQLQVSSAPIGTKASQANGFPHVAVAIDETWRAANRPHMGDVLVITDGGVEVWTLEGFSEAYELVSVPRAVRFDLKEARA